MQYESLSLRLELKHIAYDHLKPYAVSENVRGVRTVGRVTHHIIKEARSPQSLVNHSDASQLDPRRRIHAAGEAGHAPLKPFRRISRSTVEHLGCPT